MGRRRRKAEPLLRVDKTARQTFGARACVLRPPPEQPQQARQGKVLRFARFGSPKIAGKTPFVIVGDFNTREKEMIDKFESSGLLRNSRDISQTPHYGPEPTCIGVKPDPKRWLSQPDRLRVRLERNGGAQTRAHFRHFRGRAAVRPHARSRENRPPRDALKPRGGTALNGNLLA